MKYFTLSLFFFVAIGLSSAVYGATLITDPANSHYCQGTTGLKFKIQNSVNGITYKLRKPLSGPGDLATVVGNGGTVTFPGDYQAGTYITVPTTNSVTVIMDPQPTSFTVTMAPTSGKFCNYPEALGVEIIIAGSQAGAEYEVFLGTVSQGPAWPGDGASHSFGFFKTSGTYTVRSKIIATGCTRNMGNAIVIANAPPVASFTFVITNPCSSTPVQFTSTSPGTGLTYLWRFDDPHSGQKNISTLQNPLHLFEAWGNGSETFDVSLRVTNTNGCKDTIFHEVTVTQKPDATLIDVLNPTNPSYPNTFSYCGANNSNPNGFFEFHNESTTMATNTLYNITWGNCTATPTYNSSSFTDNIPITYTCLGEQSITYTVNGQNGCNNTRNYGVFVGSNPGGGLTTAANTYGVAPFSLDFIIPEITYNNTPGTMYVYDYGDGFYDTLYQETLPASGLLPHTYNTCSTVQVDGQYAYRAACRVTNPCGFTNPTVFPIWVSCKVTGGFYGNWGSGGIGWWPGDPDSTHIVGCNPVAFSNVTAPGFYIYPSGTNFTQATYYNWNFGDPASGAFNTSNLANPTHTFTASGQTYTITLITYTGQNLNNNSGVDTIVKQLYIQSNPTANFDFDTTEACVPKYVQMNDLSNPGGLGIPKYIWTVTPPNGWQIVTPGHEGDNTVAEPLFKFTAMGQPPDYSYHVEMALINSCDTSFKETEIMVCEPPEVAFTGSEVWYCGPGPRLLSPAYDLNCDSSTIDIQWQITPSAGVTFNDGTTDTSYAPVVNFPDYGDYQARVIISNGCGADTATLTVHITQMLSNNDISLSPSQFCGCTAPITITGTVPQGGSGNYTYQWEKNSGTGWVQIPVGGTGLNYMITTPLCETTLFRRTAYDEGDCSDISNVVEITIYPTVQNNLIFTDQSVCGSVQPAELTGTVPFGGFSPFEYSWEKSTDGGNTWEVISGATGVNYQPEILSQSTYFRRVVVSAPCQPVSSAPVVVNVCAPISNNTISIASTEVCAGSSPVPIMGTDPAGACGLLTFQWQKSDVPPYTNFVNISGAVGATYQPTPINVVTHYRRVVSTTALCPQNISNEITVTVNPKPVAEAGIYAPIPNGWTITLTGTCTGGTTPYLSYLWTPETLISGNAAQPVVTTIPLTATTTFTYSVTDTKGCTGTDVTVISITGNALTCSVTANPSSICPTCPNGPAHICATAAGGSGNYTYSWTSSPPGFLSTQACIDVCPTTSTNYTCVVWDGFASCSSGTTISVDPVPVVTSLLTASTCSGDTLNYVPASTVPGTTYTWTTTPGTCTGNTSGQGVKIIDRLVNTGNTPCQVTYSITPHGPAPNFCAGTAVNLVAEVMPVAQITNLTTSQVVVSGQLTTPVTFTSNVAGAEFYWESYSVSCPGFIGTFLLNGNTALLPAQILTILPGGPASCILKYKVTPRVLLPGGTPCWGTPFYYSFIINTEPLKYNLLCPPPVCAGNPVSIVLDGSDVGIDYQLLKSSVPVPGGMQPGTGDTLEWPVSSSGTYTILGINTGNQQSVLMNGQCVVTINPNPVSNYVIGSTGNCPGDIITQNGSQTGVLYELYKGNVNTLISRTGPGPLDFGPQENPGTYRIKATYPLTGCTVWIDSSILIAPAPLQFIFDPAGPLCAGDEFSLENSEAGILYSLICTPTTGPQFTQGPWIGGTGAISFGPQFTPGNYKVLAYNPLTGCDAYMDDEKIIWPNPVPYNITPPGNHCGLTEIGLDNSETGFTYQVYKIDPATGNPYILPDPNFTMQTGVSGQALVFGTTSVPWTYCVIAFDQNNICRTQMNGLVTVQASPTKYQMLPTGTLCFDQNTGMEILLEHSDLGIEYTLFLNGVPWSLPVAGQGGSGMLSFGFITVPGTYTIGARNVVNNCTETMLGSCTLLLNPVQYTLNPLAEACPGVDVWLSGSDVNVTYRLHPPTGPVVTMPGTGDPIHWGIKYQPGDYYVTAHSDVTACHDTMIGLVTINSRPGVFNVKPQGINCELMDIGLENSEGGTIYEIVYADGSSLSPPVTDTALTAGSFWFNSPQPAGSYTVKATTAKGCDTLMTGIVVIDPRPTADAGPADVTVCNLPPYAVELNGTATDFSTVTWSSPTNPSGSNFSNPHSLTSTYTFTATDLANKQVTLTLTAYGTAGCANTLATDQITVFIEAAMVDAGPDQQVCVNENISLAGSVSGGTTTGTWTGGAGVFIPDRQTLTAVYDPDPSETGTTVTLTLHSTNADPCPDVSDVMTITVHSLLAAGVAGSDQTICNGQIPQPASATLPTGGSGSYTYQWQQSDGGSWLDIAGATNLSFVIPALTATTKFRLRQTDDFCIPDQFVTTNEITVTVYNSLTAGLSGVDQTICNGETPAAISATAPSGGSASFSYQWQLKTGTGLWTNIPGATSLTYQPPALTTTTYYQVVQTDTWCNPHQDVISNMVTIQVHLSLVAGTASQDQMICHGTIPVPLTVTLPTGGSGTTVNQWQWKIDGGAWENIPSAIGLTYAPPALFVTTHFRVIQTDTFCQPQQEVTSNEITITVYGQLTAGVVASDQEICYGETPDPLHVSLPSGGSANYSVQWQAEVQGSGWTDISGATQLNYAPPALTVTAQYRVIQRDLGCVPQQTATSNVVTIVVHLPALPGTLSAGQTICYGETPAALVSTAPSGGSGTFVFQWQSKSGTGGWNNIQGATSLAYSPGPMTITTEYRVIQTDTWCNPAQEVMTNVVIITVYSQMISGTATADQTICRGETPLALVLTVPNGGSGNFAYQWQAKEEGGTWNNIPAAINLSYIPPALFVNTQYRIIQTDITCSPGQQVISNVVTVTVHGELIAGVAGSNQTICYGETPVPLAVTIPGGGSNNFTFQWQSRVNGGSWADISGAIGLIYSPPLLLATTEYRVIQKDTWCTPNQEVITNSVTVTVYNQFVAGTASQNQTICFGETPLQLVASIPIGGSGSFLYQWQAHTGFGAWNNILGATSLTYAPPALNETTNYRVIQQDTWCNPDQIVQTNEVTITVHGQLVAGVASTDQTICYGETPEPLTTNPPSGGSGNFSYQWQSQTGVGTWNNIPSAIGLTYNPPPLTETTHYRMIQTDAYCSPDQQVTSNVVIVTVLGQLTAGNAGSDQTICYGETPVTISVSSPSGGSGTYTCQWQSRTAGGSWTDIPNAIALSYSPPALTMTTQFRAIQTDTWCEPDQVVISNMITITVHGLLVAGTATSDQTICYGETPALVLGTVPAGGSGQFVYQWQSQVGTGSWNNIPLATNTTYAPPQTFVTTKYRLLQTDTWCAPDQEVTTNIVTITVHGQLVAGSAGADQSICFGETPQPLTVTIPAGGSGTFTYQWQSMTGTGSWNNIPSAVGLTYSPPAMTETTKFRMIQTDSYCNPIQQVTSNAVTVTVFGQLSAGTAGSDQVICYGETPVPLNAAMPAGGSGTYTYQWQSKTSGGNWANISNANALTYSPAALFETTHFRVLQGDTWCVPGQEVFSNSITITVHGLLVEGSAGTDQAVCYGEIPAPVVATIPSGGSGTFVYQWQLQVGSGTWDNIPGATSLTFAPPSLTVTSKYRLHQSDTWCDPDQQVTTNTVTITVYGLLVAGTAGSDQVLCNGESPAPIVITLPTGGSGNYTCQWQSKTASSAWNNIPGANSLTLTPVTLLETTQYRAIQVDGFCHPHDSVTGNVVTITVNTPLTAGVAGSGQSICHGETPAPISVTVPGGGSGIFAYQWQQQAGTGPWTNILNANALIYSPPSLTETTRYRVVQTDATCLPSQVVTSNEVVVTVFGQLVSGSVSIDQSICYGEIPDLIQVSMPGGGSGSFLYQWQMQAGSGTWNNIPGATTVAYTSPALFQTTRFRVIQKDTWCEPDDEVISNQVTVTVYDLFAPGTATSGQNICYGQIPAPLGVTAPSGGSGNNTYQWQVEGTAGVWSNIAGANNQAFTPDALTITTRFRVVQTDIFCHPFDTVISNIITINVYNQLAAGASGADQTICYGESPDPLVATVPSGGSDTFTYNWQVKDGFGAWNNILGATTLVYAPPPLFTTTQYRISQTDIYCNPDQVVASAAVTITVYNEFVAGTAGNDQTTCMLEQPATITATLPSGGSGSHLFRWQLKNLSGQWLDIPNAQTLSYTPPPLSQTTVYRLQQSDTWCDPDQVVTTNEVTVTVVPVPVPTVGGPLLVCVNSTGNVYQTEPDMLNYEWTVTGGTVTAGGGYNDPTVTVTWTTLGLGTVSVNYHEYIHNCPAAAPTVYHVNVVLPPVPVIGTSPPNRTVGCIDECITFETEAGMSNYQWVVSPGGVICSLGQGTDRRAVVKWTSAGFHWVSVNYIGTAGCEAIAATVYPVTIIPAPTPTISGPNFICEGGLTATYTTEAGMSGYFWNVPSGGTIAAGQGTNMVTVLWNAVGSHTLTVTYTNYFGCEAISPTVYTVSVTPLPQPMVLGPTSACIGSTGNIYTTDPGNSGYVWTASAGGVITAGGGPNDHTATIQWNAAGYQSVSVTYTDVNGCEPALPTTINVFVHPTPVPAISGPASVCQSNNSVVYSTQPGMSGYNWTVSPGGQIVNGTGTNVVSVRWVSSGAQTVSVNYSGAAGCNATNPTIFNVVVSAWPFSDFDADTVCQGSPTTFTNLSTNVSGPIVNYLWNFGDGQTSQAANPVHLYGVAGSYIVTLSATNAAGCVKDTIKQVHVWGKPTALFSNAVSNCAGDSVQFTDLSSAVHGYITRWTWEFGDGTTPVIINFPDDPNVKHLFINGGNYNVKLTVITTDSCVAQKINLVSVGPGPLANFTNLPGSCAMLPLQFTDLSQLNGGPPITAWSWDFGEPSTGTSNYSSFQNPMHIYQSGGPFTITLTVTNANGCTDSISKTLTVNATPVASFTVDSSCIHTPTQFNDESTTASGTIVAWSWNFGDPSSGLNNTSTLEDPVHVFNTPGIYWVSLQVTNSNQCVNDTSIMVVTNSKPIADFQHSVACMQDVTQFTDLSIAPNSSLKSWLWDFGDGGSAAIQNPVHAYQTAGTFNVRLIVTNLFNCTDTIVKPVVVRYKPLSGFNYQNYYCPPNRVDFQDSSQAYGGAFIQERNWNFEPGYSSGLVNPTHYFTVDDTTYSVTLMVTDNFGCKDTVVRDVFVKPAFIIAFTHDTACFGQETHFQAENTAVGDTLYSLHWDFGDPDAGPNNFSSFVDPSHEFTRTGTFTVWLKAWNSENCVDSVYRIVQVERLTEPDFAFQSVTCNDTVRFQDKSKPGIGTISSWKWIWGDGTPPLVITPPATGDTSHVFANEGSYLVKLIVTNTHGCVDSIVKSVNVACITATFSQINVFCCSSDSIAFLDNSSPVNKIATWHWDFGDLEMLDYTSHRDTVRHKFPPGNYVVSLTVQTISGGATVTSVYNLTTTVYAAPEADFSANVVCLGDSTRFIDLARDNQVPITSREWKFGDGASVIYLDTLINPVHKYTHGGTFNNRFVVKNTIGCKDSVTMPVVVHKLPVASFVSSAPCQRYDIHFADGSQKGDTTMRQWWWNFNDPQHPFDTLRAAEVTHRFDSTGSYPVYFKVMDHDGCIDDTLNTGFEIQPSPLAAFTYTDNYDGKPGKIKLNNETTGAKDKAYKWDFGNGKTSTEMNPVVTYTNDNQVYTIELVAWNEQACYDTTWLTYEFLFDNLFVPNAFSPTSVVLGVREFKPKGLNLSDYRVMVFDKWGHLIWESNKVDDTTGQPSEGWDGTFNGEPMPQDVYMWKISATFKNGKVWEGSDSGTGAVSTMGTVTLIR